MVHTHTECIPFGPANIHHLGHRLANVESPSLMPGYLNLNAA